MARGIGTLVAVLLLLLGNQRALVVIGVGALAVERGLGEIRVSVRLSLRYMMLQKTLPKPKGENRVCNIELAHF